MLYPNSPAGCVLGVTEDGVGEDVLITHELATALLALANKAAIGEIVAVEALMSMTLRSIDDGEGGVR